MLKPKHDFVSDEEFFVYHWLKEAERYGLVSDINYQPEPFILCPRASVPVTKRLKTKSKTVDKFLFHPHQYTADFQFVVSQGLSHLFVSPQFGREVITIDVKGSFNLHGDPKQFAINCKWVWDKFNVHVEKIIPEKLFKKSFVPEICRFSPVLKKPVKKYLGVKTIKEYLEIK